MGRITFVSFNKEGNPIDFILEIFKKSHHHWSVNNIYSLYHEYQWPDIVLSEKEKLVKIDLSNIFPDEIEDLKKRELIYDNGDLTQEEMFSDLKEQFIDILGEYNHSGYINLYVTRIEKTAYKYFHLFGGVIEDIIECLTEIVLIHETIHWLMHKSMSPSVRKFKIRYTSQDEVYYHEGMAQYFTNEVVNETDLHKSIFNWLLSNQIKRYRIFLDIIPPKCAFNDVMAGLVITSILDIQDWSLLLKEIANAGSIVGSIEDKVQYTLNNKYKKASC